MTKYFAQSKVYVEYTPLDIVDIVVDEL